MYKISIKDVAEPETTRILRYEMYFLDQATGPWLEPISILKALEGNFEKLRFVAAHQKQSDWVRKQFTASGGSAMTIGEENYHRIVDGFYNVLPIHSLYMDNHFVYSSHEESLEDLATKKIRYRGIGMSSQEIGATYYHQIPNSNGYGGTTSTPFIHEAISAIPSCYKMDIRGMLRAIASR